MQELIATARASQTFVWTLDLSEVALVYAVASATLRLQIWTIGDLAALALEFSSAGGTVGAAAFDAGSGLARFSAPQSAVANFKGPYRFEMRLEMTAGFVDLAFGTIGFAPGVTVNPSSAASGAGLNDTVFARVARSYTELPPPGALAAALAAATASAASAAASAAIAGLAPSALTTFMAAWFAALPRTAPTTHGLPWNNSGALAWS